MLNVRPETLRSASAPIKANRTLASGIFAELVLVGAGLGITRFSDAQASAPQKTAASSSPQAVIDKYCTGCHNNRAKTGGLSLEGKSLDVSTDPDTWEKVVKKLQLGVMPPLGSSRPDAETYSGLLHDLIGRLDAANAKVMPGAPLLHRLNRAEYANAVRDLLGFHVDVSSLLPPDNAAYGFDNVAEVLGNSPALLQAYLSAARKISAVAVGDPSAPPGSETYAVPQDLSQDEHLEDPSRATLFPPPPLNLQSRDRATLTGDRSTSAEASCRQPSGCVVCGEPNAVRRRSIVARSTGESGPC